MLSVANTFARGVTSNGFKLTWRTPFFLRIVRIHSVTKCARCETANGATRCLPSFSPHSRPMIPQLRMNCGMALLYFATVLLTESGMNTVAHWQSLVATNAAAFLNLHMLDNAFGAAMTGTKPKREGPCPTTWFLRKAAASSLENRSVCNV